MLTLPESLPETADEAIEYYYRAGFRPILIHSPTSDDGRCSCGVKHEVKNGQCSAGKHPIAKNWQREQSLDELRSQLAPLRFRPNVGIVLGEQQNGDYVIAIDVDEPDRLPVLEAELGVLPETVRGESGRGYRLLYQFPPGVPTSGLKNIAALTPHSAAEPNREKVKGVDVKVKGGQVVVAPSKHFSGRQYTWTKTGAIAVLPMAWVLELAPEKVEIPKWVAEYTPQTMNADSRAKRRAEGYLARVVTTECSVIASTKVGMRNDALHGRAIRLFSLCAGMFLGARWSFVMEELRRAGVACGLPLREVDRTIASAEKHVREKGEYRMPVALLADPATDTRGVPVPADPSLPVASPQDPRPAIRLSVELHENVDQTVLAIRKDSDLYQRALELVHVTRTTGGESTVATVEGSPQICAMALPTLRERMTRYARFEKFTDKSGWSRVMPTDHLVAAVLSRKQWNGIPTILGVIETPTMRPDGSILQEPGFDPATAFLYVPNDIFGRIADSPPESEAQRAYAFMSQVFADFPYEKPEHREVPIAALLTILARPAIAGAVPAFLFDASTRGSGKTLQSDVISMATTGRSMPRMNLPVKEEELEKVIAAYVLRGFPFFCFDNITRPFGGGPIELVLTAKDTVQLRVLGSTDIRTLPWRSALLGTGNNITFVSADTARRVLMARLEPREEQPEFRSDFSIPDLVHWVRMNRRRLVGAALTLLRAYVVAGRPMLSRTLGSFEEWSALIPQAILFAGGRDVLGARPAGDATLDTQSTALRCLLRDLPKLFAGREFRVSDVVDILFRQRRTDVVGNLIPDAWGDLREAVEALCPSRDGRAPDVGLLSKRFVSFKGRVVGGQRLVSRPGAGGLARWSVESV